MRKMIMLKQKQILILILKKIDKSRIIPSDYGLESLICRFSNKEADALTKSNSYAKISKKNGRL